MSNERIDLTQFEGLTTPWDFHAKYLHIESAKVAVKLIAELKRCYEEITLAHRNLSIVRNALARGYPDIEEEIWKLIDASE